MPLSQWVKGHLLYNLGNTVTARSEPRGPDPGTGLAAEFEHAYEIAMRKHAGVAALTNNVNFKRVNC